jgi:glucose/arabinose dehydrogenase
MRVNISILVLLISVFGYSQTEPELIEIATGVDRPTALVHAADGSGRLFICEQKGTVRILTNTLDGHVLSRPFLDIKNKVVDGGGKGLKGMAFHPKFPYAPYVFVSYITTRSGELFSRIERYTVIGDPNVAIAGSGRTILEFQQPKDNNNGGDIKFGLDGMLYISVGVGGGISDPNSTTQDGSIFLGSILRIDINGDDFP